MNEYDFANVLFAGPCNRSCPWCIGKALPAAVNVDNLDVFPPAGIEALIATVNEHQIPDVVLTGTISDPQLYRHEAALVRLLRERLHPRARLSLHTNGVLVVKKLDVLALYDRACISFPSFVPDTYAAMMGSAKVPDLARIAHESPIPIKVSCVVDTPNVDERDAFLAECFRIGVRRVVFRKLFGETRSWPLPSSLAMRRPTRHFKGNPVYDLEGVEVTVWDFDASECRSVNLFPDGTLGTSYLLTHTVELRTGGQHASESLKSQRVAESPVFAAAGVSSSR